jgi:hypothetical protein
VAEARTPSEITLVFIPYATQIVPIEFGEHVTLLPAAVRLDPALTLTLDTLEDA